MLEKKERVRPNKHQPELGPLYIAQCWKKEKKNSKLNLAFTPMRQSRSPVPHLIFYLRFSLPHVKTPHRIPHLGLRHIIWVCRICFSSLFFSIYALICVESILPCPCIGPVLFPFLIYVILP